jgi:Tfp pilus assembly protein PilZ
MAEKRTFPRYRQEVMADFSPAESKISGVTKDVSQGGLFVRTNRMPEEGQRLLVTLRFSDGRQLLLQGEVVRTFEAPSLVRHLFPTGFGVSIRNSQSYKRFVDSVATHNRSAVGPRSSARPTRDSR